MSEFRKYRRTNIAEMREVTEEDLHPIRLQETVSISKEDLNDGSPKIGDMIARNPNNHNDKWLVAKEYFESNFEPFDPTKAVSHDQLKNILVHDWGEEINGQSVIHEEDLDEVISLIKHFLTSNAN
ncbi:MAG TPA: hypothetical protein VFM80_09915 [Gracilimonas sp.]|uniref:hypothetical protein n=1 Tax=Gracilimonas sp. TaxID=1974203 RepID=UPI002D8DBBE4|nr:hypothetical protein [Gracilimonas sp.]